MDIRRNRSFCRVLRNRFFGSAIIIICSLCVWTYSGSGSLISPQIGSHQLIAGTGTAILFVWLPKCPLSPSTMLRSIRSAVYYYLFLVMCMWGLVFFFVSFSYTKNSRAILIPLEEIPSMLSKTLLIATSYLGHFISLIEYKTQKKSHNIISVVATSFFLVSSILDLLIGITRPLGTLTPTILYSTFLFFGAPFWYFLCLPSTQAKQDIHAPERYKVDVEMKNERGEEITWAGHANVTPCEQEE